MIIGGIDSRVSSEILFDTAPGQLPLVRNVPISFDTSRTAIAILSAALEELRIKHSTWAPSAGTSLRDRAGTVVPRRFYRLLDVPDCPCGHESWPPQHGRWLRRSEFASAELSLKNLMMCGVLVERGKLALHDAYFGIARGRPLVRNSSTGRFAPAAGGQCQRLREGSG